MSVRVTNGPAPIITPQDIPGSHAVDDPTLTALIAAVQAGIDGPSGWLGRSLGAQTIELHTVACGRQLRLPYGPVTGISAAKWLDSAGVEHTLLPDEYSQSGGVLTFKAFADVACAQVFVVEYEAGYAEPPASAKAAVIIGVQHLKAMTERSLFVRSEDVEGVGTKSYTVSEASGQAIKSATESLLAPLWVPPL